jgi:N-succinyldiaminopimelate aminotransferase
MPRYPLSAPSAQSLSDGVFGRLVRLSGAQAQRIYPLHVGDTYLEPLLLARAESQSSSARARLHNYAPVQGEPELLAAIIRKIERRSGVTIDSENLQVMAGATGAMGVLCNALLEPGDEVILPSPFWPLMRGAVRARGAVPVEVPLFTRLREPSFDPLAAIERAITPRTCAIYVNSPHNPSGVVLPEPVLAGIGELALRHNLWVISDEVYEDVYFTGRAPVSLFVNERYATHTITTHSLSKAYGLAGARVGFTHGPPEIMQVIRGVQTFYSYCAPRPMQFGAAQALDEGESWLAEMRETYDRAGRAAAEALELPAPEGGTFLFFDMQRFMRPGEELVHVLERCLQAGVMLTPGTACGSDFTSWARLCFTSVPEADLRDALKLLRGALFE